jgi:CrcB protein
MLTYFWVMLGGALGSGGRFWLSGMVAERFGEVFPLGTLVVNISGSFAIGFIAGLTDPGGSWLVRPRVRQFLTLGICGGYTTFSSFSLQTFDLISEGDWLRAMLYTAFSVIGCLLAVWLGRSLALLVFSR